MKIRELWMKKDIQEIIENNLPWERLKDSRILVTGASGMIPSYIVYTLLALNDEMNMNIEVLALVRNKSKAENIFGSILSRSDISLVVQDVSLPPSVKGKVDYIFHGGTPARPSEHRKSPTSTIRAHFAGAFSLLDFACEHETKGFILMSSSEVYGTVDSEIEKISETDYGFIDILNPRSCYSEGKRGAETICACYSQEFGIRCVMPRFAHIYGPGLSLEDGRVQADFAANVIRNENILMKSDGSSKRAYTYVADAVSGVFYALLLGNEQAYNIADSDEIVSIRQLAEAFINARPEKNLSLIIDIPENQKGMYNPAPFIGLANDKIKALGWKPKVSLEEGVDRMLKYYEK